MKKNRGTGSPRDPLARKVRFVKATVETGDQGCQARVELERPGAATYVGMADGPGAGLEIFRAGARAAAQAVQQTAGTEDARVELQDLDVVDVVGERLVIVLVRASLRGDSRSLFGVCKVQDDQAAAGALAVLSATNRVFDLS